MRFPHVAFRALTDLRPAEEHVEGTTLKALPSSQ